MALPDIDFTQIRPHDGSRHAGFEELITQLASLEDRGAGSAFVRKGRGGDGGALSSFGERCRSASPSR